MPLRLAIAAAMCATALVASADSPMDPGVRGVLTRHLKFGAIELADLERGRIVRHALESTVMGEIGVAGGIRVNIPKARFLDRLRDIVRFKRSPDVLQIGRFSNPPTLADLAALTVDSSDFNAASCRVGDCGIRLPADAIRRIERDLDRAAPDAQQRAAALFKQVLFEHIAAYVKGDRGQIAQLDGGSEPIRPVDEFGAMLKNVPAIAALVPGLDDHVREFPNRRVAGAEDFLYWSKEKFGMAPFIAVTHMTIVCPVVQTCVVTGKDVYATRYLDASLAMTIATDAATPPEAFYLVYANRSRANALKGRFSGLKRAIAERRARSSLDHNLRTLKVQLEKGS